jgi:outer membrane protein assembly factor BamB
MNRMPRAISKRGLVVAGVVAAIALGAAHPVSAAARLPEPRWIHVMRDGPWAVAADGIGVVVSTDRDSLDALDRRGRTQWSVHVESVANGTPAIDPTHVVIGGRGRVTALARADGSEQWTQPTGADVTAVTVTGGLALVGDQAGTLTALDAASGVPRWSVHYEGRLWSAPRVDVAAGIAVASWHWSTSPTVRAFDLATGALRWEAPTDTFTAAPVVERGLVVLAVGDGNRHARVEARDVATGDVRWRTSVPGSFEEAIEPAADAHGVVVVDHLGVATLFDLSSGSIRWQRDTRHAVIDTHLSLTAKRVVFTSFSGDVFVLDRKRGRVVSRLAARDLEGYPIAAVITKWASRPGLLIALRLDVPNEIELRPLP